MTTMDIKKWAQARMKGLSSHRAAQDDLHMERGRPRFAQRADENARTAVERDWEATEDAKTKSLAKFKIGAKVMGDASAFKMKGKKGTVTKVERKPGGAFVYTIAVDGGGTERALETELDRA